MAEKRSDKELEKHLKTLKGQRTWKKGAITKRIRKLEALVNDGGSRRVIAAGVEGLQAVFNELNLVCSSIASMIDEVDDLNSLEEIRMEVEMCVAMANEDLEARKEDPPSTEENTRSWVNQHAETLEDGGSRLGDIGHEDLSGEYRVRSEAASEPSGNVLTNSVQNHSPSFSANAPPFPITSTGAGAIDFSRDFTHDLTYDDYNPFFSLCGENVSWRNDNAFQGQLPYGGQQDVRLRPQDPGHLVSYGVYDEDSMSALRGNQSPVVSHSEVEGRRGNAVHHTHKGGNSSLPDLQRMGNGKPGIMNGSLPDLGRNADHHPYSNPPAQGNVVDAA